MQVSKPYTVVDANVLLVHLNYLLGCALVAKFKGHEPAAVT